VILVALGTHEQPFDRALDLVAPLTRDSHLVIQHGHTPARVDIDATWIEFAPYEAILELMTNAEAIVCHAGVGTILTALGIGISPVVVPRLARLGEHVDDHQFQITEEFADRGFVVPCLDGGDIADCVQRAASLSVMRSSSAANLAAAVAEAAKRPARRRWLQRGIGSGSGEPSPSARSATDS
jgi:UDP-N-acetylglucosamine transferase subunit ALG13